MDDDDLSHAAASTRPSVSLQSPGTIAITFARQQEYSEEEQEQKLRDHRASFVSIQAKPKKNPNDPEEEIREIGMKVGTVLLEAYNFQKALPTKTGQVRGCARRGVGVRVRGPGGGRRRAHVIVRGQLTKTTVRPPPFHT